MIVFPPTYGMKCRTCGLVVPVGTPIGIDDAGNDFVEHSKCFAKRIAEAVLDEAFATLKTELERINET